MVTYGKKKRLPLPRFLSDTAIQPHKQSVNPGIPRSGYRSHKEISTATNPSPRDDSIDELASMLLDDTAMDQMKTDPGKRLSAISMISSPSSRAHDRKALPNLPYLIFNGDDAWAMRTESVVTATGDVNAILFDEGSSRPSGSISTNSVPPIPRRSSKRKSAKHKSTSANTNYGSVARKAISKSISTPKKFVIPSECLQATSHDGNEVNTKIQQMLDATKTLKYNSVGVLLHDSELISTPKKNLLGGARAQEQSTATRKRFKDNKVLSRVKKVIKDGLQVRHSKKRHDPVRDDRLLDESSDELEADVPAAVSRISAQDFSGSERRNLRTKAKTKAITGCKEFPRKPIDEHVPRNGLCMRDPFSTANQGSPTPSDVSMVDIWGSGCDSVGRLIRGPSRNSHHSLDDPFSSSPVAQSTPRIRLERSYEHGKKSLKNVAADSCSVFDVGTSDTEQYSNMEIDSVVYSQPTSSDAIKRKSSQSKAPSLEMEPNQSKRVKKHPSPSKAELEMMEVALSRYGNDFPAAGHAILNISGRASNVSILGAVDPNRKTRVDTRPGTANNLSDYPGGKQNRTLISSKTMSAFPEIARTKSRDQQRAIQMHIDSNTMDIDELQLDDSKYHVGLGRL